MAVIVQLPTPTKTPAHVASPRPFQTYYYSSKNFREDDWSRVGRASTGIGAIRAAVVNILRGRYKAADIYGAEGYRLYQVRLTKNQISIIGYFGDLEDGNGPVH